MRAVLPPPLFPAVLTLLAGAAAAQDAPVTVTPETAMPDFALSMLKESVKEGDPDDVEAVAKAVKAVFPDYADAIDAYADARIAELTPPEDEPATEETPDDAAAAAGGVFALKPWDGKIGASASVASGNSEATAYGFALDAKRATGAFTHNVTGYLDIASNAGARTQKRWGAAYKLDYNFSERAYAFARVAFDEDEFSGFDYRLFGGGGVGYFLAKSEPFTWKIEGGPGYQYSPIDDTRETQEEFALYAASETDWRLREGVLFEQDFRVNWTDPTTTLVSLTALTTQLTDSIAAGLAFEYRYETDPPEGRVNSDRIFRATMNYGF